MARGGWTTSDGGRATAARTWRRWWATTIAALAAIACAATVSASCVTTTVEGTAFGWWQGGQSVVFNYTRCDAQVVLHIGSVFQPCPDSGSTGPATFSPSVPADLRPALTADTRSYHAPVASWVVGVYLSGRALAILAMDKDGNLRMDATVVCPSRSSGGFGDLYVAYVVAATAPDPKPGRAPRET